MLRSGLPLYAGLMEAGQALLNASTMCECTIALTCTPTPGMRKTSVRAVIAPADCGKDSEELKLGYRLVTSQPGVGTPLWSPFR